MAETGRPRVVGFVPAKLNSERVAGKNIRHLGGTPLVNHALRALGECMDVDETYLYTSTEEIMGYVEPGIAVTWLRRPEWLDTQEAKVQDFVGEFLKAVPDADVIVLLHITAPFISPKTISACVRAVTEAGHDSAFAVVEEKRFAWFQGKPLNYDLAKPVPRTQDIDPVVFEQSGLYVFRRDVFETLGRRIGDSAYLHAVGRFEGHDIDEEDDFTLAEIIYERGLARAESE